MFEDYHVHTAFSDDSVYEMEQVVQDAIQMGMDELCFTDHVDYGIKKDWTECTPAQQKAALLAKPAPGPVILNVNYDEYFPEIERLKKKYGDQISIKTGMEFGMQSHTAAAFRRLYDRYKEKWDFILLSVHQVGDRDFWTQDFQKGNSQEAYNRAYYEELLSLVRQYKDYSVLGHLDLICRYDLQGVYPFEEVQDLIEEILRQIIQDGKGLEINTSSVRYQIGDLTPSRKILALYKKLGGTILTFGSDSHQPDHLGQHIQAQKQELKELGFTAYCTYEKMQPVYHSL